NFAGLWLDAVDHALDQWSRREILSSSRLLLTGVPLQQPFVQIAQPFFTGRIPIERVNAFHQPGKIARLPQRRVGVVKDGLYAARALVAQMYQQGAIEGELVDALLTLQIVPAIARRKLLFSARFLGHLEEQQKCQLSHILMIRDAIIAQDMAE